jgi:hypothetical protein
MQFGHHPTLAFSLQALLCELLNAARYFSVFLQIGKKN